MALHYQTLGLKTELQKEDTALQVSGCREYLGLLTESGAHGFLACQRCAVFQELYHQAKELQEEVSRLSSIREDEKHI